MCPCFDALDEIYGQRQNIEPSSVFGMGVRDKVVFVLSDEEEDALLGDQRGVIVDEGM
jgi:hypothetical protein